MLLSSGVFPMTEKSGNSLGFVLFPSTQWGWSGDLKKIGKYTIDGSKSKGVHPKKTCRDLCSPSEKYLLLCFL